VEDATETGGDAADMMGEVDNTDGVVVDAGVVDAAEGDAVETADSTIGDGGGGDNIAVNAFAGKRGRAMGGGIGRDGQGGIRTEQHMSYTDGAASANTIGGANMHAYRHAVARAFTLGLPRPNLPIL